ncbi:MAG: PspA/IM30 family protein [Pleurocapsa sp. MO_226.B13]|nr:PspA/IM30 family protein [Pleurocapsa sp. MO_226.B13]
MGLFDRLSRVVRANINDLVSKAEDPEKVLEQAVVDMQEDLVQLRQAVARAIATQKRTEQQYNKNQSEANNWQQRAQLALGKGDENLAREALVRKKSFSDTAASLKIQLDQQSNNVATLKRNLIALESKISEAKTKKDMLKARANAAKAQKQLQDSMTNIDTSSALGAFERMEDKVMQLEAESESAAELGNVGIEQQFAALEAGSGVDDELAAMKAQLSGTSAETPKLEAADTTSPSRDAVIDAELDELRSQLDK